jgi:hypothetical protein
MPDWSIVDAGRAAMCERGKNARDDLASVHEVLDAGEQQNPHFRA